MSRLLEICISKERGTAKVPVGEAVLREDWGLEGDAHAGSWHRQVSLLAFERIEEFRRRGGDVDPGAFGENLIIEGLDLRALPVGTRITVGGEAILELTQIGKECHSHCEIYKRVGDCIMPREGVFARVVRGGQIQKGDQVQTERPSPDRPFTAAVITLSDKGAIGERKDESGPLAARMLEQAGYKVEEQLLLADGIEPLKSQLIRLADQRQIGVIFTTGGTGFSPRDLTPEATIAACDRMAEGIAQAILGYSLSITPRAMFSRAVSGIRGGTLIVNLPGSPKAVREALEFLLPHLEHGLGILRGTDGECGGK